MSLRNRVTLIVATLVMCGIAVASVLAYTSTANELVEETDRFLEQRVAELVGGKRQNPRNDSGRNNDRGSELAVDADAIAQTLDENGTITASSGRSLPVSDVDVAVAAGRRTVIRDVVIDGVDYRMISAPAQAGGAVQVASETTSTSEVLSRLRWRLAGAGATLCLVAALLGWVLMRQTTKPLEELTEATDRVASSADLTPLRLDRRDEVGRLANSFDQMVAALAMSRDQQRRLVQDAGHELRTPLTSLRTNIELLHRAPNLASDEREALMAALIAEVSELGELFNELIELAADAGPTGQADIEFDMADVVADAVERFRRRTLRDVRVDSEPTPVVGNPTRIDRAVTNLLGNAHKFSPADEPIDVVVADGRVVVRDRGDGIPADEHDRVFERFYRAESARSETGSGLGLAIVRQIAERHGGTAFATTPEGGGAEVGFSVARPPPARVR